MQIKITFSLILLTFIELLKVVLIDMIVILMMSVNLAIPGLLNAKEFWNKGYGLTISVHDATNKILSCDWN